MLELLIVIAIMAILIGLTFSVMNGITEQARAEATKATINKVNRLLEQRIEGFERAFKGGRRDSYVKATVGLLSAIDARFDHFNQHPEQAPAPIILLARKAAFRFEFPQRMVELILTPSADANGNLLPDSIEEKLALPNARNALIQAQNVVPPTLPTEPTALAIQALVDSRWQKHIANRSSGTDKTESSELLYYTLVASGAFGASPVDADQFSTSEVADTDDDGLPEFVDAWGEPLRFYRWPTRLVDPTAPNPFAPNFNVVDDPTDVDPRLLTVDPGLENHGRRLFTWERNLANVTLKGLPPAPAQLPTGPGGSASIQRDLLFVDPDDPVGLLYGFIEDPQYKSMNIDLTLEFNEAKYHTPDTYHSPLVISAGADKLLGLREPYDTNAAGGVFGNLAQYAGTFAPGFGASEPSDTVKDQLFDNITSRNRRAGGNR